MSGMEDSHPARCWRSGGVGWGSAVFLAVSHFISWREKSEWSCAAWLWWEVSVMSRVSERAQSSFNSARVAPIFFFFLNLKFTQQQTIWCQIPLPGFVFVSVVQPAAQLGFSLLFYCWTRQKKARHHDRVLHVSLKRGRRETPVKWDEMAIQHL